MLLSEYIAMLTEFAKHNEDLLVHITEEGFYSGDRTSPELYSTPVKETSLHNYDGTSKRVPYGPYYSLGHSAQNY